MSEKNIFLDLVSLVKVFDANYVSGNDSEQLSGLDVNQEQGVSEAVHRLLLPEFHSYTEAAQVRLLNSLRIALADPKEDFDRLFDRVEFAFDLPVKDKKRFMRALLRSLESTKGR